MKFWRPGKEPESDDQALPLVQGHQPIQSLVERDDIECVS
jgi:hypothetical protein